MNAEQILIILQLLTEAATRLQAIAREDPGVWEQIKGDFNQAAQDFKDGMR